MTTKAEAIKKTHDKAVKTATQILTAYRRKTARHEEKIEQYHIADLLCDLMHLCNERQKADPESEEWDFDNLVHLGEFHFDAELRGEDLEYDVEYKVHIGGNRYKRFPTVEAATEYCSGVFTRRNVVLSIVED